MTFDRKENRPVPAGLPVRHLKDSIEWRYGLLGGQTLVTATMLRPPPTQHWLLAARGGADPIGPHQSSDLLFAFECDNLIFGRTNNPYNLDRTGRDRAAVSPALIRPACGSPFGLAADAAGSVTLPAHYWRYRDHQAYFGTAAAAGHVHLRRVIEMICRSGQWRARGRSLAMMRILVVPMAAIAPSSQCPLAGPAEGSLIVPCRLLHRQRYPPLMRIPARR